MLLAAIVAAGILGPAWPAAAPDWLSMVAVPLALGGAYPFLGGAGGLGRQLTPFPRPLISSSLAPLPWAVAPVFLEAKRRREEAWLVEWHPDYKEYQRSVSASFVPFVW